MVKKITESLIKEQIREDIQKAEDVDELVGCLSNMPQALHLPQRALNQTCYYTAAIPEFRSWRQEEEKFKGILGYVLSSRVTRAT